MIRFQKKGIQPVCGGMYPDAGLMARRDRIVEIFDGMITDAEESEVLF